MVGSDLKPNEKKSDPLTTAPTLHLWLVDKKCLQAAQVGDSLSDLFLTDNQLSGCFLSLIKSACRRVGTLREVNLLELFLSKWDQTFMSACPFSLQVLLSKAKNPLWSDGFKFCELVVIYFIIFMTNKTIYCKSKRMWIRHLNSDGCIFSRRQFLALGRPWCSSQTRLNCHICDLAVGYLQEDVHRSWQPSAHWHLSL